MIKIEKYGKKSLISRVFTKKAKKSGWGICGLALPSGLDESPEEM